MPAVLAQEEDSGEDHCPTSPRSKLSPTAHQLCALGTQLCFGFSGWERDNKMAHLMETAVDYTAAHRLAKQCLIQKAMFQ